MKKGRRRWIASSLAGLAIAAGAHGQSGPADPLITQAQIDDIQHQVQNLKQNLEALQAQLEADKAAAEEARLKLPVVTAGREGFSLRSSDGQFQLRIRGIILHDFAAFSQDRELERAVGEEQKGTGFRAARLRVQGKLYDTISFNADYDFAGETGADSPQFRDTFIQFDDLPLFGDNTFNLRVGYFREPFSLEDLTPIAYRTFMERSLAHVFTPGRNPGVQVHGALFGEPRKERVSYAAGVFRVTDNWPSSNDSRTNHGTVYTGRVTGLPYYAEDGRKLVHVGASYSRRNPRGENLSYGVRPESRLALFRYSDPNNLPVGFRLRDARAETVDLYGLEAAGVYGPFSLQGQYERSEVETTFSGDQVFDGYYAQASYFLTGEHRPYRHADGTFAQVRPNQNFNWKERSGPGAWELTARYSAVDMNSGPIRGGEHAATTVGVNWYLNPLVRVMVNATRNDIDHDLYSGKFDVYQARLQIEF